MDVGARLQSLGLADRNRVIRLDWAPNDSSYHPTDIYECPLPRDPTLHRQGREGSQWVDSSGSITPPRMAGIGAFETLAPPRENAC